MQEACTTGTNTTRSLFTEGNPYLTQRNTRLRICAEQCSALGRRETDVCMACQLGNSQVPHIASRLHGRSDTKKTKITTDKKKFAATDATLSINHKNRSPVTRRVKASVLLHSLKICIVKCNRAAPLLWRQVLHSPSMRRPERKAHFDTKSLSEHVNLQQRSVAPAPKLNRSAKMTSGGSGKGSTCCRVSRCATADGRSPRVAG